MHSRMDNWITKKHLLLFAVFLVVVKFAVLPILAWQDGKMVELSAKSRQLKKVIVNVNSQDHQRANIAIIKGKIVDAAQHFYPNNSATKLVIQKDVESIFENNDITINGFDWIFDSPGPIRSLRATVFFSGPTHSIISTFWDLGRNNKWVRQVASNQQLNRQGDNSLGMSQGNITLEFYATAPNFSDVGSAAKQDLMAKQIAKEDRL